MDLRIERIQRMRRSQNWADAIAMFSKEAAEIKDDNARAQALFEIGQLAEEVIPTRTEAIQYYEDALAIKPDYLDCIAKLVGLYAALCDLEGVARTGRRAVKSGETSKSLLLITTEALYDSGSHSLAKDFVTPFAGDDDLPFELRDVMAAFEATSDSWKDSVERLTSQVEKVEGAEAARIWLLIVRLTATFANDKDALNKALAGLLKVDIHHRVGNIILERKLASEQDWDAIAALHESRIDAVSNDLAKISLCRDFGMTWLTKYGDLDRAQGFILRALTLLQKVDGNTEFPSLIAAVRVTCQAAAEKMEGMDETISLLRPLASRGDETSQLYIALRLAEMAEFSADSDVQEEYLLVAAEIEPYAPLVIDKLGAPADSAEKPAPVQEAAAEESAPVVQEAAAEESVPVVEEAAAEESAPVQEAAAEESAPVVEEAAAEESAPVQEAEDKVEAAPEVEEDEGERPVLTDDVQKAIDEALSLDGLKSINALKSLASKQSQYPEVHQAYTGLLRKEEKWSRLIEALKGQAAAATRKDDKFAALEEMADVYESHLNNPTQWMRTIDSMLEINPKRYDLYDRLATFHESKKRWQDMVKVYKRKAENLDDKRDQVTLYEEVARLYVERFSNQAEAIKTYEKILSIEPENSEAVANLLVVYEKRRDWAKYLALRETQLDELTADDRLTQTIEIAELAQTKVKKPEICKDWWEAVLALDPSHEEATGHLIKIYERLKSWELLAEVCEKQVDNSLDSKAQADALQKLGVLYTDRLENAEAAANAWRRLLEIDPDHRRAQDAIRKLYVANQDWEGLEEFYRGRDKVDEFVRVMERQVDQTEDPAQKTAIGLKVAGLYANELGKADRAARQYEKVLSFDSRNFVAAEALVEIYEKGRDPKKLANVLEIQLEGTEDPAEKLTRTQRLAELYEEKMRDKSSALSWWIKAHEGNRSEAWIRENVERLADETSEWEAVVSSYLVSADAVSEEESLPLLKYVAKTQEMNLNELEAALKTNQRIWKIDDTDQEIVEALERLHLGSGDHDALLAIYERKLEIVSDAEEQEGIYLRIGSLYEHREDYDKAIDAYQNILDLDAQSAKASLALGRLYEKTENWQAMGDIYEQQITQRDPDDDRDTYLDIVIRLAQLKETRLDDVSGAIDGYTDALSIDGNFAPAREGIEKYLENNENQKRAADTLEPLYQESETWDKLVGVFEIQLQHQKNEFDRVSLLSQIGEIQKTKLGNAELAFDAYRRCLKEDPASDVAKTELEDIAVLMDDGHKQLVELYQEVLKSDDLDPMRAFELSKKVATTYHLDLALPDESIPFYQKCLEQDASDMESVEALEMIFGANGNHQELLSVLKKKAEIVVETDKRNAILFRVAGIYQHELSQVDDAISAYGAALANDPTNINALRALEELLEAESRNSELDENLSRQLDLAEDSGTQIALLLRLGALRETKLKELERAVECHKRVLEIDPSNQVAIASLERMADEESLQLPIATILEPIYRVGGDIDKQILVYEVMAKNAYEPTEQIRYYHQIGELHELNNDPNSAFSAFARGLQSEPSDDVTQAQLERIARASNNWTSLVSLYESTAKDSDDEELKTSLLTKVARVYETELQDDAKAVSAYQQVVAVGAGNVDAAVAIETIHRRNDNYDELVKVLLTKADITQDATEQKKLLFESAYLQEHTLSQPQQAVATYQKILESDDTDIRALDSLINLYTTGEDWNGLKEAYTRKAELSENPQERKQLLFMLGQLHEGQLEDSAQAIDTYQSILDIDPSDIPALQSLDRLFGQGERWYDQLNVLEQQLTLESDPNQVVTLKYRVGQLWQIHLKDMTRAVDSYREALQSNPTHQETLAALEQVAGGDEEQVAAAEVLESVYEASGQWAELARMQEVKIAACEDLATKVTLLHKLAENHEYRLGDENSAFLAYGRALQTDSSSEVSLSHLERLAESTGSWSQLASLLDNESGRTDDVPVQIGLMVRLAFVQEAQLAVPADAIATYNKILEVDPDNVVAIRSLDRLYTQTGNQQSLVSILKKQTEIVDSDEERMAVQFRLAQTLENDLSEPDAAVKVYSEMLEQDRGHEGSLLALEQLFLGGQSQREIAKVLEPIYEDTGEYQKLHYLNETELALITDKAERAGMHQRLAELCEGRLDDLARAQSWWAAGMVEDPEWVEAIDSTERLAEVTDNWAELVTANSEIVGRSEVPEHRRNALLRIAKYQETRLNAQHAAVEANLSVLGIDERDADALSSLDRLYANLGDYSALVEVLKRRADVTMDGDEITNLHLRRGQVCVEVLGDYDQGLAAYDTVLEQDPTNRFALEASERLHYGRADWTKLFATYERFIDVSSDDNEMAATYARMGRIAADGLENDEQAIELWARVTDIRGENLQSLQALSEIHERREEWNELVEISERQISIAEDPQERCLLFKRLGRLWEHKLKNQDEAVAAWRYADEQNPHDIEVLQELARLFNENQEWEDLSQVLQRQIEVGQLNGTASEDQVIQLYSQIGQLEGEVIGRVPEAVDAWRRVTALDPGNMSALSALEQLFTREGRWEEAIEVLEKRALLAEAQEEKVNTLLQVGVLWQERVENLDQAAAVYERVREFEPNNHLASVHLEKIYRAQYRWEELTDIMLERVQITEDSEERIAIFSDVAKVYEQELGAPENAFVVLQYAFQEDFGHEQTALELERLATATGQWQELLTQYSQVVKDLEAKQPDSAADLWVKIGRWYGEKLSHVDYGIHSVQQALRLSPHHSGALSALADLQRQRGSWSELTETLQLHASVETDQEKQTELYLSLANLLENQLQDPQRAIQTYQSALEVDGGSAESLHALERLYRGYEQWDQLIMVLGRQAEQQHDSDEVIRLKLEIGEIWDTRLVDSGEAIQAYQQVLDLDPSCVPALQALEQLYEKTGQSEKYLETLEAELDLTATDHEQVSLYERMATAWEERFGKLDRAAECYEKIVALDGHNFPAYRQLGRIYRQDSKWESLVDTFRNHILVASDPASKVDLYCSMATVYENELQDVDRAIEAYNDVLAFDSMEPRALNGLGRLYEKISEWDRAIEIMGTLEQSTSDPNVKVDLLHRMGRISFRHLADPVTAEEFLQRGLAGFPSHIPTMEALVELYSMQGDWIKAAGMMGRAEEFASSPVEKVKLLVGAAEIYRTQLEDMDHAKDYYASAVRLDPEHTAALEPLADIYFAQENWEQLGPVIGTLIRKTQQERVSEDKIKTLYYRAARCSEALNDFEKASAYYKAAYDLDPTHLPTLVGRGDLLFRMEDWDGAAKIYQTVLVQHRDSHNDKAVVDVYYKLGRVRIALNEKRKALNMFEKALEINPHHQDTLLALIDLQTSQQDFASVVQAKRSLMVSADTDEARLKILEDIGDIQHKKLGNSQKAIVAYADAVAIDPNEHRLLQKLLELYSETGQWQKAVEIIERFISRETDPFRKAAYLQAAGTVCRKELKDHAKAIEYYDTALDSMFESGDLTPEKTQKALKPFEYIDKMLTSQKDWKAQERAYRRMIKRLPSGSPILVSLWNALGEIYRSRLKHYQSAIQAFEIAQSLEPTNAARGAILAELYVVAGPEYAEKAVQLHSTMLQNEPFKYDSYRALRKLYSDAQQYDKAWCICAALAFLKKANPEEIKFYEQYKQRGFAKATRRMNDELWRAVTHEKENPYISAIFGQIWQGPASMYATPLKKWGLKRKDARPAEDQLMFSRMVRYAAQVMNVAVPDIYVNERSPGALDIINASDKNQLLPSFAAGQGVLQGKSEKEIVFLCGRYLDLLRPQHILRPPSPILPTKTEQKTALLSAIAMVRTDFPVPAQMQPNVQAYLPEMRKRIPPQVLEQLGAIVSRFLTNAPRLDMNTWNQGVDATGHRVGFILCGDLEVAARSISAEPTEVGGLQVKDKIKDLVLFSISEDYFKIRQALGMTIG